ncbi:MAG: hypothetical protein KF780_11280 [Sphingomonas sp.]|nr:hypothetical protein [Sphingomonas sp.]
MLRRLPERGGGVTLEAYNRNVAVLYGEERTLPVAFAIAPGAPLVGDNGEIGARARIPLAVNAALVLGYDGRFGSGYESHHGLAGSVSAGEPIAHTVGGRPSVSSHSTSSQALCSFQASQAETMHMAAASSN